MLVLVNGTFYVLAFSGPRGAGDCAEFVAHLTQGVLSLSSDHSLFGNDKMYSISETPSKRLLLVGHQKPGIQYFFLVSAAIG
jgi:hypothetical protein